MSAGGEPPKLQLSARWIPDKPDTGELYASFTYFLHPQLGVGMDYRPLVDEVAITGTWRALPETATRPGIVIGTAQDEFGDVSSRHYYGTLSKRLGEWYEVGISPYVGASYIDELEEWREIGGLHLRYDKVSLLLQYTGVDTHLTLSYALPHNQTVSVVAFDLDLWGLAWFIRI